MGKTAKGLVQRDGDLKMPSGLPWCDSGTTGMRFLAMKSYPPQEVFPYINNQIVDYPAYQDEIWDCEDHAFLAAAQLRCNFPGIPVAIAIGNATHSSHESIKGFMHAVNYIWFQERAGDNWKPVILDPAGREWVDGFDPKVIIPMPISGKKDHNELSPFEQFTFQEKAAFQLDVRAHKFDLIADGTVGKALKDKAYKRCTGPKLPKYTQFVNKLTWSPNDTVFFAFAQIRRIFMGAPVGVAFGDLVVKNKPKESYAALVLWSSADQFTYWDVNMGVDISSSLQMIGAKFEPRVVIV